MKKISIIIPTWNEEENITPLVKRIDDSLSAKNITYELIFIDDRSTDKTKQIIKTLSSKYPISVYSKNGKRGKAQSLLEGFALAKYELVGMIDADLQYPPEAIPKMIEKIGKNTDIVVANRRKQNVNFRRKVLSFIFLHFFGKFLHGLNYDVQSGLKVFRKEIIKRIKLHPSQWTFDLEFLVKARNAGYLIDSVDITFSKRHSGKPKINLFHATLAMAIASMKVRLSPSDYVPLLLEEGEKGGHGFHHKGRKFVTHTTLHHKHTAVRRTSTAQKIVITILLAILAVSIIVNFHITLVVFVSMMTILYFIDLLFNLFLITSSFQKTPEIKISKKELQDYNKQWPRYTVFCPLYKESAVLPQFIKAMIRLDYPKDKLEVMLLLEDDDQETIQIAKKMNLPSFFRIVIVPHSVPKTKPKACNYGLAHATGEYAVIYDAEDIPDPDQLKKAVLAFEKTDDKTICIQSKLNYYNPNQNLLTKLFTAEYSLWFDLILTGLQSIHAPIPLGGTSNHFKTKDLNELEGWDPFNVTEDADLGMRIVKRGYHTAIMDSMTMEEANSNLINWFKQRSRWIKGYMQTYLVHMRRPGEFISDIRKPHVFTFQLIIGGKILSMLINPIMWAMTISYFAFRPIVGPFIESLYLAPIFYLAAFALIVGNFLYMYYYMIGLAKREQWELIKYTFFVPFYWLAMSVAAAYAAWELLVRPHHWNKTKHGLHLSKAKHRSGADLLVETI